MLSLNEHCDEKERLGGRSTWYAFCNNKENIAL